MTPSAPTILVLSGTQSLVLLATLLLPPMLALLVLRTGKRSQTRTTQPDWSIPAIETQGNTLFHGWATPVKIGSLLICSFLIASLTTLLWAGVALLVALSAVQWAGIPWRRPLRRLAAMSGFLSMLLVILPLTSADRPNETVLLVPGLASWPFHLGGLILALIVICKAASIGLLMEPMLATAPLTRTLRGFTRLCLPATLVETILLCHRYLFVIQEETARMQRAVRVRGFVPRTHPATLRTMGNCFGMLFIRSFERTERVHQAMLSRGYRGTMPIGPPEPITGRDLCLGAGWLLLGLALVILDRLVPDCMP